MPQLDTVYIFMTFLWTWLTLHLTMQKITTLKITANPTNHPTPHTTALLWL